MYNYPGLRAIEKKIIDNSRNLKFKESKWYYSYWILWALLAWFGAMSFGYFIGGVVIMLYSGLAYIYQFLLMVKIHYKEGSPRSLDRAGHILLVICIFLLVYSTTMVAFWIILLAIFIVIPAAFLACQFLACETYSMHLNYNENNRMLSVTYDKLYIKIIEKIHIPENAQLKIIATDKFFILASRKKMYHVLQINHKKIYIAPGSLNGFSLFNKIITLLPKENIQIGFFPPTNSRLFVPQTYGTLTVPSSLYPHSYYEIEDLDTFINSPNFKLLAPRTDTLARTKAMSIILLLWIGLIYTVTATMMSIIGLAPKIPFSILKYYIGIEIFVLAISILVTRNALAVWFGKLDLIITEKSVTLLYHKYGKKVEVEIHRSLNPVLIIENSILFLIILNNGLDYYYKHRIGSIENSNKGSIDHVFN